SALLLDCATLEYQVVPFPNEVAIAVIDSGEHRSLAATPYNQRRREAESGHPKRRRHVDSEIARVREFVDALHDRDFPRMGELLKESHASLRDDFEVSMPLGDGEAERLTIGIGSGWKPIEVPRQLAAHEGRQSVWYRTEFPRPDHAGRVVLRIGGAFLATNVWLNGRLLGSHYGYFAPFGFDLTPYLKAENLLVICCESPVEPEPEKKRHIMGLFNDGDLKPYPASAYSSLPDSFRLEVPVGLWRPVELEYVGPIAVDWM